MVAPPLAFSQLRFPKRLALIVWSWRTEEVLLAVTHSKFTQACGSHCTHLAHLHQSWESLHPHSQAVKRQIIFHQFHFICMFLQTTFGAFGWLVRWQLNSSVDEWMKYWVYVHFKANLFCEGWCYTRMDSTEKLLNLVYKRTVSRFWEICFFASCSDLAES